MQTYEGPGCKLFEKESPRILDVDDKRTVQANPHGVRLPVLYGPDGFDGKDTVEIVGVCRADDRKVTLISDGCAEKLCNAAGFESRCGRFDESKVGSPYVRKR